MINFIGSDKFTRKDKDDGIKMAEKFFPWIEDENYVSPDEVTYDLIKNIYPNSVIYIKDNAKLIGHAFILPCNKRIMNNFLAKKINEKQMFHLIKDQVNEKSFDCIYLASAFVLPEYRKKGLATKAMVLAIKRLCEASNKDKPILFYEALSAEGNKLSKKVNEELGFEMKGFVEIYQ